MASYQRQAGLPLALFVGIVVLVVVVVLVVILVIGSSSQPPVVDRSSPEAVYNRVVPALERSNMPALYAEMSPAVRELFPLESLVAGEQSIAKAQGRITRIQVLEALSIKTGPEWNSEWAEAKMQISRGTTSEVYIARFHRENGQWWLVGTLRVE